MITEDSSYEKNQVHIFKKKQYSRKDTLTGVAEPLILPHETTSSGGWHEQLHHLWL